MAAGGVRRPRGPDGDPRRGAAAAAGVTAGGGALTRAADSIAAAAAAFNVAWVTGMRDLPGNPAGIAVERAGGATVLVSRAWPDLDFVNSVHRLTAADVAAATAAYRRAGTRGWCELAPGPAAEETAAALDAAGWAQVGFHCSLAGPADPPPAARGVAVEAVGAGGVAEFARVLVAGHGVPDEHREIAEAAITAWLSHGWMRLFAARIDGRVVAAGALALEEGVGYLANAATLPGARGRGAQTALIAARMAAAAEAGCDSVVALAEFGSTSQRNLERAGLRVAYTQAVWRMRP